VAREKLGSTFPGLFRLEKPIRRENARRKRRHMRLQVNLGSENLVLVVLMEAMSREKARLSSTNEDTEMDFSVVVRVRSGRALDKGLASPAGRIRSARALVEGMGVTVDAGLSSLYTAFSMVMTCSSISSTTGKNESTTESSIP